jgi:hypothetical protein
MLVLELRLHDRTHLGNLLFRQDQTLGKRVHEGIQIGLRVLGEDGGRGEKESH